MDASHGTGFPSSLTNQPNANLLPNMHLLNVPKRIKLRLYGKGRKIYVHLDKTHTRTNKKKKTISFYHFS